MLLSVRQNQKKLSIKKYQTPQQQLIKSKVQYFIISLFPKLNDYNAVQSIQKLGIIGKDILTKQICSKCQTIGNENMLRLNC